MQNPDPRFEKFLKYQSVATFVNLCISGVAAYFLVLGITGAVSAFLVGIVISAILLRILNAVTMAALYWAMYRNDPPDLEALRQEVEGPEEDAPLTTMNFTVVASSDPIGRFMDNDLYDWIDVTVEGNDKDVLRLNYVGTVDVSRPFASLWPAGTIVLPPGVCYQVATP